MVDRILGEQAIRLAMLLKNVHVVQGLGGLSTAYTDDDIAHLRGACQCVTERFRKYIVNSD